MTVYPKDQDTYDLWLNWCSTRYHQIRDNFWEIGEGPCGQLRRSSLTEDKKYDPENIGIRLFEEDIENDRYIEIWNIVFSQFNSEEGLGHSEYPIPNQNIDTGMGLERMACVFKVLKQTSIQIYLCRLLKRQKKFLALTYTEETRICIQSYC